MLPSASIPVIGFFAFSANTGKTTLLTKLLPILKQRGLRVGVIKHTHHDFEIDKPGKDSYELRKAGAQQTLVASRTRWALIVETERHQSDPGLDALLQHLEQTQLDLILVEGFKHETFPKIELHRGDLQSPWLFPGDDSIIAVASDVSPPDGTDLPYLDINNPQQIADFICRRFETA